MSCSFCTGGILLRVGMEAASASLVLVHLYLRPHVLVASVHGDIGVMSQTSDSLTLVSVTTKHILLQWACNRHLSMVELPHATRQAGKTEPGDLLHLHQGLLLDHSGKEEASCRITFESSGQRKQEQRPFFGFWHVHCRNFYLNGSPACAVSSTWTWVNQLLTLVQ